MFANLNDQRPEAEKGFTLIELSIVIVIIGLIVAGVVGGEALVKQAKIRAQIAQLNKYKISYNSFKLGYNAIPGDMRNASDYWPFQNDGNGDGRISTNANAAYTDTENRRFFQHLSAAGLVNANYENTWQLGVGFPSLKINANKGMLATNTAITALPPNSRHQVSSLQGFSYKVALSLEYSIVLSGHPSFFNDYNGTASPRVYYSIDNKIDDGNPVEGIFKSLRVFNSIHGNCLTGVDGDYLVTNDEPSCIASYMLEK